ncbi:uncharacterized protein [Henckelia pumila]|uniref:uncharacterized protein n=1 Tax=Henckelia pumila TaxID=405737 RepID=UPI003C6DE170
MEGSAAAPSHNSDYIVRPNYSAPIFIANLSNILVALGIFIAITFVVVSAIVAITLILRLSPPIEPDFSVDSFSLSNFTFTTNGSRLLFMDSEVRLKVSNPNVRYSLSYENTVASVYYKYELLSQRGIPGFSHKARNKTSLVIKFAAGDVDQWVVDGIKGEIGRKGNVSFNLWFISGIVWGHHSSEDGTYRVLCPDLVVRVPSDGSSGELAKKPEDCVIKRESDFIASFDGV